MVPVRSFIRSRILCLKAIFSPTLSNAESFCSRENSLLQDKCYKTTFCISLVRNSFTDIKPFFSGHISIKNINRSLIFDHPFKRKILFLITIWIKQSPQTCLVKDAKFSLKCFFPSAVFHCMFLLSRINFLKI